MTIIEGVLDIPIGMIPITVILSIFGIILYKALTAGYKEYKVHMDYAIENAKEVYNWKMEILKKKVEEELIKLDKEDDNKPI